MWLGEEYLKRRSIPIDLLLLLHICLIWLVQSNLFSIFAPRKVTSSFSYKSIFWIFKSNSGLPHLLENSIVFHLHKLTNTLLAENQFITFFFSFVRMFFNSFMLRFLYRMVVVVVSSANRIHFRMLQQFIISLT